MIIENLNWGAKNILIFHIISAHLLIPALLINRFLHSVLCRQMIMSVYPNIQLISSVIIAMPSLKGKTQKREGFFFYCLFIWLYYDLCIQQENCWGSLQLGNYWHLPNILLAFIWGNERKKATGKNKIGNLSEVQWKRITLSSWVSELILLWTRR